MDNCTSHKELLLGLNLGHEYAFEQVFKLHFGEICYFVEKLTGSPFVAEDIVATIFLKLWEKKPEFESLQKLKAYLFIVSRNASLDYLRLKDYMITCTKIFGTPIAHLKMELNAKLFGQKLFI